MNKNKYLLLLFFVVCFCLILNTASVFGAQTASSSSSTLSQDLEVHYPTIFGVSLNKNSTLPEFVKYFFNIGLAIAGVLALISFTMGAIGMISPNVEAHGDARDRMKGSLLGLLLIFSSFLIMQTINPKFTTLTISNSPDLPGVYLVKDKQKEPCPAQYADTSSLPTGTNIEYCCDKDCKAGTGPTLLVSMFPKTNFKGNNNAYAGVNVERVECNGKINIDGSSFALDFEIPGVYMYLGQSCSGYGSGSITTSQNRLDDLFRDKVKSIRIVNDDKNGFVYGAILHEQIGLENGGKCSTPLLNSSIGGCQQDGSSFCCTINTNSSAMDVFMLNKTPNTSGEGITLFSEPYGWNSGSEAGFYNITTKMIEYPVYQKAFSATTFDYTNVDRPSAYTKDCSTFQKCPGSIRVKGSYFVAAYSKSFYCQTFTSNVENLNAEPLVAANAKGDSLTDIYVFPTK